MRVLFSICAQEIYDIQYFNFVFIGIPDAPLLDNIQQSVHSNNNNGLVFNFDILQSGIASSRVIKYNITISGCSQTYTTLVDVTELNATYNTLSVGALPVCCEEYEFRAFSVDTANRESESVTVQQS